MWLPINLIDRFVEVIHIMPLFVFLALVALAGYPVQILVVNAFGNVDSENPAVRRQFRPDASGSRSLGICESLFPVAVL
ncbi:hypothetical protein TOL_0472 [Thalassolituus oleivorans MIL-1]|uniref:Uncharacterized protein n=1 Tax=Thalassolituus oleivorans MIL-1 TaxID=1298593 RepID=M5DNA0_9GAMM|nr:hypothetical protein TOL_0472 [Thalassolituus oleivorans MIL-1]